MGERRGRRGVLFLVCGPSGAGKDAVIEGVKRRLAGDPGCVFPLRVIIRPAGFGDELHVAVTPAQFDRLRRRGAFALCWGSRGLNYAIPVGIESDLARGRAVVVNVSPDICPEARARYPGAVVVWVAAPADLCRRRLMARGRESLPEIDQCLQLVDEPPLDDDLEILVNDGPLDTAVDTFLRLIEERTEVPQIKRTGLPGSVLPTGP